MAPIDQLVAFAGEHLLVTSTLVGLALVVVLERGRVLGWLGGRVGGRSSSRGGLARRLVGAAGRAVLLVPRLGVRGLRAVARLLGRLRVPSVSVSKPSLPALPRPGVPSIGVPRPRLPSLPRPRLPSVSLPRRPSLPSPGVGATGGVRRALGALWLVPRRLGAVALGWVPAALGGAGGAVRDAWSAFGWVRQAAVLLLYLAGGLVVGWLIAPMIPL